MADNRITFGRPPILTLEVMRRLFPDSDSFFEVMSWIGADPADLASTAAAIGRISMHWRLLGYGMFAVEQRTSGEIVGRVGLMQHPDWPREGPKIEVGWTLHRSICLRSSA